MRKVSDDWVGARFLSYCVRAGGCRRVLQVTSRDSSRELIHSLICCVAIMIDNDGISCIIGYSSVQERYIVEKKRI